MSFKHLLVSFLVNETKERSAGKMTLQYRVCVHTQLWTIQLFKFSLQLGCSAAMTKCRNADLNHVFISKWVAKQCKLERKLEGKLEGKLEHNFIKKVLALEIGISIML